eukprot:gene17683-24037_t
MCPVSFYQDDQVELVCRGNRSPVAFEKPANQIVSKGGRQSTSAPVGTTAAGLRKRATSTSTSATRKAQQTQFYTDDTPGLKISPVVVIGMSLGFILFVTVLHVVGKEQPTYRGRTARRTRTILQDQAVRRLRHHVTPRYTSRQSSEPPMLLAEGGHLLVDGCLPAALKMQSYLSYLNTEMQRGMDSQDTEAALEEAWDKFAALFLVRLFLDKPLNTAVIQGQATTSPVYRGPKPKRLSNLFENLVEDVLDLANASSSSLGISSICPAACSESDPSLSGASGAGHEGGGGARCQNHERCGDEYVPPHVVGRDEYRPYDEVGGVARSQHHVSGGDDYRLHQEGCGRPHSPLIDYGQAGRASALSPLIDYGQAGKASEGSMGHASTSDPNPSMSQSYEDDPLSPIQVLPGVAMVGGDSGQASRLREPSDSLVTNHAAAPGLPGSYAARPGGSQYFDDATIASGAAKVVVRESIEEDEMLHSKPPRHSNPVRDSPFTATPAMLPQGSAAGGASPNELTSRTWELSGGSYPSASEWPEAEPGELRGPTAFQFGRESSRSHSGYVDRELDSLESSAEDSGDYPPSFGEVRPQSHSGVTQPSVGQGPGPWQAGHLASGTEQYQDQENNYGLINFILQVSSGFQPEDNNTTIERAPGSSSVVNAADAGEDDKLQPYNSTPHFLQGRDEHPEDITTDNCNSNNGIQLAARSSSLADNAGGDGEHYSERPHASTPHPLAGFNEQPIDADAYDDVHDGIDEQPGESNTGVQIPASRSSLADNAGNGKLYSLQAHVNETGSLQPHDSEDNSILPHSPLTILLPTRNTPYHAMDSMESYSNEYSSDEPITPLAPTVEGHAFSHSFQSMEWDMTISPPTPGGAGSSAMHASSPRIDSSSRPEAMHESSPHTDSNRRQAAAGNENSPHNDNNPAQTAGNENSPRTDNNPAQTARNENSPHKSINPAQTASGTTIMRKIERSNLVSIPLGVGGGGDGMADIEAIADGDVGGGNVIGDGEDLDSIIENDKGVNDVEEEEFENCHFSGAQAQAAFSYEIEDEYGRDEFDGLYDEGELVDGEPIAVRLFSNTSSASADSESMSMKSALSAFASGGGAGGSSMGGGLSRFTSDGGAVRGSSVGGAGSGGSGAVGSSQTCIQEFSPSSSTHSALSDLLSQSSTSNTPKGIRFYENPLAAHSDSPSDSVNWNPQGGSPQDQESVRGYGEGATSIPVMPSSTSAYHTSSSACISTNPTSTSVNPTSTSVNPTSTFVNPTSTSVNPSSTSVNPTSTFVNPSSTSANPTSTSVNPTSTFVNPSSTSVNPTSTSAKRSYTSTMPPRRLVLKPNASDQSPLSSGSAAVPLPPSPSSPIPSSSSPSSPNPSSSSPSSPRSYPSESDPTKLSGTFSTPCPVPPSSSKAIPPSPTHHLPTSVVPAPPSPTRHLPTSVQAPPAPPPQGTSHISHTSQSKTPPPSTQTSAQLEPQLNSTQLKPQLVVPPPHRYDSANSSELSPLTPLEVCNQPFGANTKETHMPSNLSNRSVQPATATPSDFEGTARSDPSGLGNTGWGETGERQSGTPSLRFGLRSSMVALKEVTGSCRNRGEEASSALKEATTSSWNMGEAGSSGLKQESSSSGNRGEEASSALKEATTSSSNINEAGSSGRDREDVPHGRGNIGEPASSASQAKVRAEARSALSKSQGTAGGGVRSAEDSVHSVTGNAEGGAEAISALSKRQGAAGGDARSAEDSVQSATDNAKIVQGGERSEHESVQSAADNAESGEGCTGGALAPLGILALPRDGPGNSSSIRLPQRLRTPSMDDGGDLSDILAHFQHARRDRSGRIGVHSFPPAAAARKGVSGGHSFDWTAAVEGGPPQELAGDGASSSGSDQAFHDDDDQIEEEGGLNDEAVRKLKIDLVSTKEALAKQRTVNAGLRGELRKFTKLSTSLGNQRELQVSEAALREVQDRHLDLRMLMQQQVQAHPALLVQSAADTRETSSKDEGVQTDNRDVGMQTSSKDDGVQTVSKDMAEELSAELHAELAAARQDSRCTATSLQFAQEELRKARDACASWLLASQQPKRASVAESFPDAQEEEELSITAGSSTRIALRDATIVLQAVLQVIHEADLIRDCAALREVSYEEQIAAGAKREASYEEQLKALRTDIAAASEHGGMVEADLEHVMGILRVEAEHLVHTQGAAIVVVMAAVVAAEADLERMVGIVRVEAELLMHAQDIEANSGSQGMSTSMLSIRAERVDLLSSDGGGMRRSRGQKSFFSPGQNGGPDGEEHSLAIRLAIDTLSMERQARQILKESIASQMQAHEQSVLELNAELQRLDELASDAATALQQMEAELAEERQARHSAELAVASEIRGRERVTQELEDMMFKVSAAQSIQAVAAQSCEELQELALLDDLDMCTQLAAAEHALCVAEDTLVGALGNVEFLREQMVAVETGAQAAEQHRQEEMNRCHSSASDAEKHARALVAKYRAEARAAKEEVEATGAAQWEASMLVARCQQEAREAMQMTEERAMALVDSAEAAALRVTLEEVARSAEERVRIMEAKLERTEGDATAATDRILLIERALEQSRGTASTRISLADVPPGGTGLPCLSKDPPRLVEPAEVAFLNAELARSKAESTRLEGQLRHYKAESAKLLADLQQNKQVAQQKVSDSARAVSDLAAANAELASCKREVERYRHDFIDMKSTIMRYQRDESKLTAQLAMYDSEIGLALAELEQQLSFANKTVSPTGSKTKPSLADVCHSWRKHSETLAASLDAAQRKIASMAEAGKKALVHSHEAESAKHRMVHMLCVLDKTSSKIIWPQSMPKPQTADPVGTSYLDLSADKMSAQLESRFDKFLVQAALANEELQHSEYRVKQLDALVLQPRLRMQVLESHCSEEADARLEEAARAAAGQAGYMRKQAERAHLDPSRPWGWETSKVADWEGWGGSALGKKQGGQDFQDQPCGSVPLFVAPHGGHSSQGDGVASHSGHSSHGVGVASHSGHSSHGVGVASHSGHSSHGVGVASPNGHSSLGVTPHSSYADLYRAPEYVLQAAAGDVQQQYNIGGGGYYNLSAGIGGPARDMNSPQGGDLNRLRPFIPQAF